MNASESLARLKAAVDANKSHPESEIRRLIDGKEERVFGLTEVFAVDVVAVAKSVAGLPAELKPYLDGAENAGDIPIMQPTHALRKLVQIAGGNPASAKDTPTK
ncbi:MAG: hypothetical protein U0791_26505 [Gemmataceae bacterium]